LFGLLILRITPSKITVAFQAWARLVLCSVFVFAGANFSHGSDLHHQPGSANASHHSAIDQNLTDSSIIPHSHFEQEIPDYETGEIAVHCGSPELQPIEDAFSYNMDGIGAVENCFRMLPAGMAFNLEPPPPRS